jgi:DNA primase
MSFSPAFLDELRNRLSLVGVIGRRVKLTRKGREHSGLCPFHNEKSPSFTVNEDKGFFHCFGCGAHGDVIGFEMRAGNLSFPEAVEKLAGEAGIEVPAATPEERAKAAREASLHEVMEAASGFFEAQLRGPRGREALGYLTGRGLDDEAIARFRLGFSPDSREALKSALMSEAMPESLLIEAGLLIRPEGGGPSYDRFRGRVMFPITDRKGRVIAFGGRIMGDGQPKYLNSPDTPLFHKGRVLYGLAQARTRARDTGQVLVAEGYMDVIALHCAGFDYAVAPLGTALTETQIEELWKLANEPTLCFDGDAAGGRAAMRAAERALPMLTPGKSLRIAMIPPPDDPDSLIKTKGPQAMQSVIDRAEPLSELVWRAATAGRPVDTPERQAALQQELNERATTIADRTVSGQYQQMFRQRLKVLFWDQSPRASAPGFRRGKPDIVRTRLNIPRVAPAAAPAPKNVQERILVATLINHPSLLSNVGEALGSLQFTDKTLDSLRREILKHEDGSFGLDSTGWESHLRSRGYSEVLNSLLCTTLYAHAAFARPDAELDKATAGWGQTFRLYTQSELTHDVARAEADLAADGSVESFNVLVSLASQIARETSDND